MFPANIEYRRIGTKVETFVSYAGLSRLKTVAFGNFEVETFVEFCMANVIKTFSKRVQKKHCGWINDVPLPPI